MKKLISIILTVALLSSVLTVNVAVVQASSDAMLDIYVSPTGNDNNNGMSESTAVATLSKAQEIVEDNNSNMTGNIVVHILPGYYKLDEKLVFGSQSGGTNGYDVIYKGEGTDVNPSIVGGGTQITGWTDLNDDGIWKAPANIDNTRSLYVNGYPAQRAKSKYLYKVEAGIAKNYIKTNITSSDSEYEYVADVYWELSHGFKIPAENILYTYAHPEELELVWPLEWTHQRTPVENVFLEEDTNYVVFDMKDPYWMWANKKEMNDTNPIDLKEVKWSTTNKVPTTCDPIGTTTQFYIENALELLDEPGEFYFDKTNKEIYYKPFNGENLETAETYVGTTEFMVNIEGTSSNKVKNIVFDNLEFRYGAWNEVTDKGISVFQADNIVNGKKNQHDRSMPAQFTVNFAKDIDITDCKFLCLGSSAIKMENGVSDSLIQGNIIRDISGTGIMIDSFKHKETNGSLSSGQERCDNISVLNNVIHRVASEFKGMVGISMYFPSNTKISHNDIKRVPYSGIVAGWGWGNYNSTGATGNEISNNKIEDVMNISVDGGHIYTLDTIPGLKIKDNYLVKSSDYRGGIYLDSGSEGYTIENNVVENSLQWFTARTLRDGSGNETSGTIKNITARNNYYDEFSVSTIDTENVTTSGNTRVERTNNSIDGALQWPTAASSIIANAGLQSGYASLLNSTTLPSGRTIDAIDMEPKAGFKDWDSHWIGASDFSMYSDTDFMINPSGIHEGKYVPIANLNSNSSWISSGYDWLEYKVTVDKALPYNLQIYAKISENNGTTVNRKINVSVDGGTYVTKTVTGTYYNTYDLGSIGTLSVGEHTIRLQFPDSYQCVLAKLRLYNSSYYDGVTYDEGTVVEPDPVPVVPAQAGLYETGVSIQTGDITCSDFNEGTGVGADTSGAHNTAIIMEVGESAEWTINANEAGMCDLRLFGNGWERKTVQSSGGTQTTATEKVKPYAKLTVNGTVLGQIYINNSDGASSGTGTIKETILPSFAVNKGANTIKLEATGNVNLWKNMTYKVSYGGKLECETYIENSSSIGKTHGTEGRITMYKGSYAEYTLSPGKAGKYQLVLVGNSSESLTDYPTQVTLNVNGTEVATTTLNRDSVHNDCINYPSATVLAEVDLEATGNTIKLTEAACTAGWDYVAYQLCEAQGNGTTEVTTIKNGIYTAIANLGSEESATLIVGIYSGDTLVSAIYSDTVTDNQIVLDNISVQAGQTVKVFVWDDISGELTPLTQVKIYE